ncbi:MAG: VWA domain-containing protein [Chitinophagaceae bacterium]|nr:VWA domain-containing protein [Chitinophagaceae bacterium]
MLYDWLKEIDFAQPLVFAQLLWVPVLIWRYVKKNNRNSATIQVSTAQPFNVTTGKNRFRHLPFILRLLAIICLVVALARPQKRNDQEQTLGEGIDIVLCLDVSGSMGSRDILPSRMEVAKQVAAEFILSRPVDRIGIVIFSGEAFTLVPLTTDKNVLVTQVQSLESRKYLADGTVIGEGLATAVDRLSQSQAKSKVIILLTDGKEDPPETRLIDPLTALEIARAKGVKVYTIGMGALPTSIVERAPNARQRGNPAIDFIDEDLLRRIAEQTGGRYFRAKDKEALKYIYSQIDKQEKSKVEITSYKRYEERFFPFVLAALVLVCLELLLRFTVFKKFP